MWTCKAGLEEAEESVKRRKTLERERLREERVMLMSVAPFEWRLIPRPPPFPPPPHLVVKAVICIVTASLGYKETCKLRNTCSTLLQLPLLVRRYEVAFFEEERPEWRHYNWKLRDWRLRRQGGGKRRRLGLA